MTPEQIKLINLSVETCGVILCLLGIILVHVGTKIEKRTGKYFEAVFICLAVDIISNMAGQLIKGMAGTAAFFGVRIANFCEFFFGYMLTFFEMNGFALLNRIMMI